MSVLLDTCVVVDVLRHNRAALTCLRSLTVIPSIAPVTLLELSVGFRSRRDERDAQALLESWTVAHIDDPDLWRRAGQFMKHYAASHGLDEMDALIAATAEHHGLKLTTVNVKHFPMFKGLKPAY